ncbi:HNH endonuclease [Natrinema caseinilyticum]|uniref:HNH endonuclease n=1 Tax=Natrinema caseinilyticum TaxID=2961570 RepID=UPI0020C49287|nr:HNH endonuclease [Natrinema caseinilyticum]
MRHDIRQLQDTLLASQFACVPSGQRRTTDDFYPAVKDAHPDLCDDNYRCGEVCSNGNDQPEWKHAVRRVQQQLKRQDGSRISGTESGTWIVEPPGLYLVPVSDEWRPKFKKTVNSPVPTDADTPAAIEPFLPARIWGTTETESPAKQSYIRRLRPTDHLLFYADGDFFAAGQVGHIFESPEVGDWLWNHTESLHVFTVTRYQDWAPSIDDVWDRLDYGKRKVVNGFMRVDDDLVADLRQHFGSLDAALFDTEPVSPASRLESPKRVTTEYDRIQRDTTQVNELKRRYQDRCQVCNARLEQGNGDGYSEVHHIKPLGRPHEGPDAPSNMLVLCPNHHADFDNGMLRVDPNDRSVKHLYDDSVDGRRLDRRPNHEISADFLEYHNTHLYQGSADH